MAVFNYAADTATGERVRGTLDAADEASARCELAVRGLTVVELAMEADVDESIELAEDQLSTLVQAVGAASASRVPLEVTLAALAEEQDDPRLARGRPAAVGRTPAGRDDRRGGRRRSIANCRRRSAGCCGPASRCGDLAGTVEKFAQQRLASRRARLRIRTAIAYPLLILAILVPLALFLSLFVIPMFGEMFTEFDLELPHGDHVRARDGEALARPDRRLARPPDRSADLDAVGRRPVDAAPCAVGHAARRAAVDLVRPARVCRDARLVSRFAAAAIQRHYPHRRGAQRPQPGPGLPPPDRTSRAGPAAEPLLAAIDSL